MEPKKIPKIFSPPPPRHGTVTLSKNFDPTPPLAKSSFGICGKNNIVITLSCGKTYNITTKYTMKKEVSQDFIKKTVLCTVEIGKNLKNLLATGEKSKKL